MNVARLNCSHGDWDTKKEWVQAIRHLSPSTGPVAVLADLQGPKFRISELPQGQREFKVGEAVTIGMSKEYALPIFQPEILAAMTANCRLLLGDGQVEVKITEDHGDHFTGKVVTSGVVKSKQGVTLVGKVFDVPSLTDKDKADIREAVACGVDYFALSYVRSAADIRELRREVDQFDPTIKLCAKIETRDGVRNIDEILQVADVVMVARGDMGLQMEIEEVPLAQKKIIRKCSAHGKPVITATQMLESMMSSPRPTRAEATDVANAILDGTDAVMLSGETAAGDYPVECVRTMARIAEKAEGLYNHNRVREAFLEESKPNHIEAVAYSGVMLAEQTKAAAVVTITTSGQTARAVAKFRPSVPILCGTWNERTRCQLAIVRGVETISLGVPGSAEAIVESCIDEFCRSKRLKIGDEMVIVAGIPAGVPGHTNMILTQKVK